MTVEVTDAYRDCQLDLLGHGVGARTTPTVSSNTPQWWQSQGR